jgi:peptidoglycan/LPS O-acetylase OafA/YrhL
MDSARGIFMIIGVFLHAAVVYRDSSMAKALEQHPFFDYLIYFIHLFRMEGFFIVAGFFAALLMSKYGPKKVLFERIFRLGIPMITIGMTLNYLMNRSTNGNFDVMSLHYYIHGQWLVHLWFLGNLITYIALTAYLFIYRRSFIDSAFKILLQFSKKTFFPFMIAISTISYYFGYIIYKYVIAIFIFIDTLQFFQYLPFYFLGYLLFNNIHFFNALISYKRLLPHIIISGILLLTTSRVIIYADTLSEIILFRFITIYLGIVLSLSFILFFKSSSFFNSNNINIRKLSDASYSIYLLHFPFLVGFFHLYNIHNPIIGFLAISLSTLLSTYFIHKFIIQKFQIASLLLNGSYIKTNHKTSSHKIKLV